MIHLLMSLVFFSSLTANADCQFSVTQWGVNGAHLSDEYVIRQAAKALASKRYSPTVDANAKYNLHVHYFGMISTNGRAKTVGTTLNFSEVLTKKQIAISSNEQFIGTARFISKTTLDDNLKQIASTITQCEE